ncbi:MAG: allophanate hydrolase subunit 1 [Sedimentitalea sp.]
MEPSFKAIADHSVLVTFADEISDETHARVLALDKALACDPPAGMIETVPALVNLLVAFDVMTTDHRAVEAAVRARLKGLKIDVTTGATRVVHVCYEPPFAPDLAAVVAATGLGAEAVINAHLAGDYCALMYGFSPGYAYLAGVPEVIQVPRKKAAVRDIPAGSVIIAGAQCLVTTLMMPTGWSIIGRSPTKILTQDPARPFLLDVGDTVVFERIDMSTFDRLTQDHAHG